MAKKPKPPKPTIEDVDERLVKVEALHTAQLRRLVVDLVVGKKVVTVRLIAKCFRTGVYCVRFPDGSLAFRPGVEIERAFVRAGVHPDDRDDLADMRGLHT